MKMSGIELPGFIFGFRYWTIQLTSWTASWLSRRWRCPGSPTPSWWKLCSSDHLWNDLSFRMTLKYCFFYPLLFLPWIYLRTCLNLSWMQVMRTKKIFVGGLSATTSLEDIKAYFEQFSKVGCEGNPLPHRFLLSYLLICSLLGEGVDASIWQGDEPSQGLWICHIWQRGRGGQDLRDPLPRDQRQDGGEQEGSAEGAKGRRRRYDQPLLFSLAASQSNIADKVNLKLLFSLSLSINNGVIQV